MMNRKTLGRTGLQVTVVGLGGLSIGGLNESGHPGPLDEAMGIQTVHAALHSGCNLIDTAPLYGVTRGETIIGNALKERPDLAMNTIISTKVGRQEEGRDYSFDAVMRQVEESQRRLSVERFDLVNIHDAMDVPVERIMGKAGALAALRRLQQDGVVRFIGTAANDPDTNAFYIETGEFDAAVVAESWSLLNQHALKRILPAAEEHDVGLLCATPIERGILVNGPVSSTGNYLNRNPSAACIEHVYKIKGLCEHHGISLLAAALQWCTRHPQVAVAIPGARTPGEARENGMAGAEEIPDLFWNELEPLVHHWELGIHL